MNTRQIIYTFFEIYIRRKFILTVNFKLQKIKQGSKTSVSTNISIRVILYFKYTAKRHIM